VLQSPQAGNYFIAVMTQNQTNATFSSANSTCSVNSTCFNSKLFGNVLGVPLQFYQNIAINSNDYNYYYILNATENNLLVSVQKTSSAPSTPVIYAGFNRIPQVINGVVSGYDLTGCNVNPAVCLIATVLQVTPAPNVPASANGTWYLLILNNQGAATNYNIWFGNTCPGNCSSQGTCNLGADNNYGTCACNSNFKGIVCAEDDMFIEYVILIIIAALVLISALLGLIAWAYMRKRHSNYEVIKN